METRHPDHDCRKHLKECKATPEHPYHFIDSGLPNVFLSGIKYYVCSICNKIRGEIPAVLELMNALARALVAKRSALTHNEIKFLRKRLGMKAADFAAMMGISAEQFSRWENNHNPPSDSADRLIRIAYSLVSGDKKLKQLVEKFQQWSTSIVGSGNNERILAERTRNHQWCAEAESVAAA